jgi:hypothetical protein
VKENSRKEMKQRERSERSKAWEEPDLLLLALQMKGGCHEPRNADNL